MKFSAHINRIVRDACSMVVAFKRMFGRHVNSKVLGTVYNSCIRSKLEYGATCWDPILTKDVQELERAQKLAARHYLNDWNVSYEHALEGQVFSVAEVN